MLNPLKQIQKSISQINKNIEYEEEIYLWESILKKDEDK